MTANRVRNWSLYNRSLVRRGDLCIWISEDLIAKWRGSKTHGNQKYSDVVIRCAFVLKQVYGLTLRSTEGMMSSILKLMKIDLPIPNYTTICRRGQSLKVNLNPSHSHGPRHILVDATGVKILGEGEWKIRWHGRSKKRLWRKLHLAIDADTQMILASKVTESERLDCNYLEPLLNEISGPIMEVTGDAGYDKKICYRAVHRRDAKAVFPPQKNSSIQRNKKDKEEALKARDEVIQFVGKGPDRSERLALWKKENNYHRRSLAETTMSRLKYLFGDEVRAKSLANQTTELATRCAVVNQMNRLGLLTSTI